jgi:hypothetical protein
MLIGRLAAMSIRGRLGGITAERCPVFASPGQIRPIFGDKDLAGKALSRVALSVAGHPVRRG